MVNQASLLVDACCDAGFRAECQKMAAREAERDKEKKEKEALEKASKGKGKEVVAERSSARTTGREPEFGVSDPVALEKAERALKRQREGSLAARAAGGAEGEVDGDLPPLKRPRAEADGEAGPSGTTADVDMVDSNAPKTALAPEPNAIVASQSTVIPSSSQPGSPLVPTLPGTPATSNLLSSTTTPLDLIVEIPAPAAPPPPPPPPPFLLPQAQFASLTTLVASRTNNLNVEQLEQLRAMLLDAVWRRRADWDRAGMIEEMRGVLEEFVGEVEEDQDGSESE